MARCGSGWRSGIICARGRATRWLIRFPGWRQSADLVEKGKAVGHAPMFDKLFICKPADVDDINRYRLA